MEVPYFISWIFLVGFVLFRGNADPVGDKQALLDFVSNLRPSRNLNWNQSYSVCRHWTGVTCNEDESRVLAVRLPGVGFDGPIPPNTISRLTYLKILSLRSNKINGVFPSDFSNLTALAYLYLQDNNFSGSLPMNFSTWKNLVIINLSHNGFNGSIPHSLSNLTQLQDLNLANNSLSGEIPDLNLPSLQHINLSNNMLTGALPKSLKSFPISGFSGNNISFGSFLPNVPSTIAPSSGEPVYKSKTTRKLSEATVLVCVIVGSFVGIVAFAFLVYVCCFRRKSDEEFSDNLQKVEMSPEKTVSSSLDMHNKLFFFEGCNYTFDLEDLLRASADVLGKGTFGTAYKAILDDSTAVVVKRLKDVCVGKRDFEQQMEIVGSIRHENVVDLKAYYYSKDEKLIVYDYYSQGSVSTMLHGKRVGNMTSLDWETRMRIAMGAAKGLARIHEDPKLVHGNVKSSNIFLNSKQYGCVSDHGLTTVMSPLPPPISRAAGYRAPEVTDTKKSSQASDVYSFGVVLLELLTGKSPIHTTTGDEIIHLVRWVHSVVREEWTAEVFDTDLMKYPNIDEEMVEMLQIAMACVSKLPDQRPKMAVVVKMIENVRQLESENNRSESSTPQQPPPPPPVVGVESEISH